jgi:sarcosine oxidase subunit beta
MGTWGFKGSPIFGKLLAEALVTGRVPELIAPFAVDRFERDRMVPDAASAGTH